MAGVGRVDGCEPEEYGATLFGSRHMETATTDTLARGGVVDVTTIGARTGAERRIEIVFHQFDGRYYITGRPGFKRDWLANLIANPNFTVHLRDRASTDVSATAREITAQDQREAVLYRILTESWGNEPAKAEHILPRWVDDAPLVEFTVA